MRRKPSKQTLFALLAIFFACNAFAASEKRPLDPDVNIRSVWSLSTQPCNGGGENSYSRFPDEAAIKISKKITLPEIGYSFSVPQIPGATETVVKVHLNDHSRGVTDHYLLLSDQDLKAPFAAIVITPLPAGMQTRESAFQAARTLQSGLAKGTGRSPELQHIDGPYGDSLEMLMPNRVGTQCFPTATFAFAPENQAVRTMGISRFAFVKNSLIEFSLILQIHGSMSDQEASEYAQSVMSRFWLSLSPI